MKNLILGKKGRREEMAHFPQRSAGKRRGRWHTQASSSLRHSHFPNVLAKGKAYSGWHMRGEKCAPSHLTFLSLGQAELEADLSSPPTFRSSDIPIRANAPVTA